jgi:DUF4097 and DUF4098 domain-containing protein YvlB
MSNKLEQFIKENRLEFDSVEPSGNLWENINTSMSQPKFFAGKVSWLKYLIFGVSAITVIAYLSFNANNSDNLQSLSPIIKKDNTKIEFAEVDKKDFENYESVIPKNHIIPTNPILSSIPTFPPFEQISEHIDEEYNFPNLLNTSPYKPSTTSSPYFEIENTRKNIWFEKDNKLNVDTAFSGINSIVVNTSGFDVKINSGLDERVFFTADLTIISKGLSLNKRKRRITYSIKDSVLSIKVENIGKYPLFMNVYEEQGSLEFDLPKTTKVVVNNFYGNVYAKGLEGKICEINTNAGDTKVENISTTLNLKSVYGNITATKIIGNLNAIVNSGDLKINNLTGNLDVKSTHGNQTYNDINGNLKLAITSGDVKMVGMKGDINIVSKYGNISVKNIKGSTNIKSSSGDIEGENVNITNFLTVVSNYGNVKMDLANEASELSFDLTTRYGKITCDVYDKKLEAEHELFIDKGKIKVKGITNSGDQSYR